MFIYLVKYEFYLFVEINFVYEVDERRFELLLIEEEKRLEVDLRIDNLILELMEV